ncbi:hypothetical protein NUW54_g13760 [Trametes sanguinea]|uniref:Uncharacterized protein n=1 Tax=Trametes sanguinea TaxID=158606 RepID=A0ACC1MJS7_9APHY|nr:hypothetical protein NUW54_g13760 [Trametes sanguinea]
MHSWQAALPAQPAERDRVVAYLAGAAEHQRGTGSRRSAAADHPIFVLDALWFPRPCHRRIPAKRRAPAPSYGPGLREVPYPQGKVQRRPSRLSALHLARPPVRVRAGAQDARAQQEQAQERRLAEVGQVLRGRPTGLHRLHHVDDQLELGRLRDGRLGR